MQGPLVGTRVLEQGDHILVPFAARLLVDLGAEVIKVEPPGGDRSRMHGPFPRGVADPERSGLFHALNAGKAGARVNAGSGGGSTEFHRLLAGADIFLTDDGDPFGEGSGLVGLSEQYPQLVVALGSTFGPATPALMGTNATALHACAASGFSSLIGHPDRMPLPLPVELGDYVAGANLAAAAVAAHLDVLRGGAGQLVEVATAEVLSYFAVVLSTLVSLGAPTVYRAGRSMPGSGGCYPFRFFECADGGAVAVACRSQRDWLALLAMIGSPEWASDDRWSDPFLIARELSAQADERLEPWFRARSAEEVFELARGHNLPLAPVRTIAAVLDEPQVRHRGSLTGPVPVGDAGIRYLRTPARFSRTPVGRTVSPGPSHAHAAPIAGFTGTRGSRGPAAARASRDTERSATPDRRSLLRGLTVLDLSWVWSGPMVAATLADLGAEVIKVEHRGRLDNARLRGRPWRDGKPMDGPVEEISIYFHQNNRGKKSVELDLKDPEDVGAFRQLARRSDIVIENLTPGVFDKLGLGYDDLSRDNERLIWLAMSAAGRDGPLAGIRAYAPIMSAIAGLEALVGYPDDPTVGMITAGIADPNASSHALVALFAALVEREHSGRGQFVDFSQIEAMVADMCEPIAEFTMHGHQPEPLGSAHARHCPHGNYPCRGRDSWVAIAVVSDDQWKDLVSLIGRSDLVGDQRLATAGARLQRRQEVDEAVAAWTGRRDLDAVVRDLAGVGVLGVPVHDVEASRQLFSSLRCERIHPFNGVEELAGVPWGFSETPVHVAANAPLIGQHNDDVLGRLSHGVDEALTATSGERRVSSPSGEGT